MEGGGGRERREGIEGRGTPTNSSMRNLNLGTCGLQPGFISWN